MGRDNHSFIRNLKVLASPASHTDLLECTLSLKHNSGDESGTFLLTAPGGVLGLHNEQQQDVTLIYNAENLLPDQLSLDNASEIPKAAHTIARHASPKWKSLSLKLKEHCPMLCPILEGDMVHQGSSDSPLNLLINLAQAKEVVLFFDLNNLHHDKQVKLLSILRQLNKCKNFPIREPKGLHLVDNYQSIFGSVTKGDLPLYPESKKRLASASPPPPYSKRVQKSPGPPTSPTEKGTGQSSTHAPSPAPLSSPTEKATTVASTHSQVSIPPASPTPSHLSEPPSSPIEKAGTIVSTPNASFRLSPVPPSNDQQSIKEAVRSYLPRALESIINRLLLDFLASTLRSPSPPARSPSPSSTSPNPNPTPSSNLKYLVTQVRTHMIPQVRSHVKAEIEALFANLSDREHILRSTVENEFIEGIEDHKVDVSLIKDDAINELQRERDHILCEVADSVAEILRDADKEVNTLYEGFVARLDRCVEGEARDIRDRENEIGHDRGSASQDTSSEPRPCDAVVLHASQDRPLSNLHSHTRPHTSLTIPGLRDDAVHAYSAWHSTQVRSEDQKKQYKLACELTLNEGLDLELVFEDQDVEFYTQRGVCVGVARRWVRDVQRFVEGYRCGGVEAKPDDPVEGDGGG